VDVQNDFCEGGSLAVVGGARTAEQIGDWWRDHHNDYYKTIGTMDWHPSKWMELDGFDHFSDTPDYVDTWPAHCIAGTDGAEYHHNLRINFDVICRKGQDRAAYSGFEGWIFDITGYSGKTLESYLAYHRIEQVEVCGIAFDYCVRATAIDARNLGFSTTVVKDLTASVAPDNDVKTLDILANHKVDVSFTWELED
jgi:nicotinamidase/pyrazinamidase